MNPNRNERGVTILEVTVSLALLLVVSTIFYEAYIGTMRAGEFLESHGDLNQYGQKAVNTIKADLMQGRYLFQNDTLGQGYMSHITLTGLAPQADTRLPQIDVNGTLVPDTGSQTRVGNALLIARQVAPLSMQIDVNSDGTTETVLADRYQFYMVFTAQNTARKFPGLNYYLDLATAASPMYADYFQLMGYTATVRSQIVANMVAAGVTMAWNNGQTIDNAFYAMASSGNLTGPTSAPTITMPANSLIPQLKGGRVSGNMVYSVGITTTPAIASVDPISQFGIPGGNFPGGFETLVVGPAGARKIMVRLCLLSQYGNKVNSQVNFVTATTQQM